MTEQEIKTAKHTIEVHQMEINDLNKYIELTRLFKYLFRNVRDIDHNMIIDRCNQRLAQLINNIELIEWQISQSN